MMPVHACTDCDGRGGAHIEEPGEPTSWWKCEGCDASGETTSCRECSDPMSRPEAEEHGYCCVACRALESYYEREVAVEVLRRMG
jgi:hypothetical protein